MGLKGDGMGTELVADSQGNWAVMKQQADVLIKSGFLPQALNTPEKVLAVILTGKELGIGAMESIRGISVIQGKPTVSPQLMLALAFRTKGVMKYEVTSNKDKATCVIQRKNSEPFTSVFSMEDARKMGLADKDNWKKQPEVMMRWRAISQAMRVVFPDAISGLYLFDELSHDVEISDSGEVKKPVETLMEPVAIETVIEEVESVPVVEEVVEDKTKPLPSASKKKLFDVIAKKNIPMPQVRSMCQQLFGKSSSNQLSVEECDSLILSIEALPEFTK